jgi:ribosomal protein S27AE
MPTEIVCPFCDAETTDIDSAREEGWEPYYYADEHTYVNRPVCPACSSSKLTDHSNDPILKPEFRAQSERPGDLPGPTP